MAYFQSLIKFHLNFFEQTSEVGLVGSVIETIKFSLLNLLLLALQQNTMHFVAEGQNAKITQPRRLYI